MTDLDLDAIEQRRSRALGALINALRLLPQGEIRTGCVIDSHDAIKRDLGAVIREDVPALVAEIRDLREQQAYAHKCMEAARVDQASRTVHQVKASILTIKPRDILVISVPKDTTQQQAHDIRKAAQAELDAHNVNAPVLIVTFDTDPKIGRLVNSSDPVTGTVPNVDVPGSETP